MTMKPTDRSYAVDRTETTMGVWMGLTAGCAVCHDHKFDPVTTKDYYSLASIFARAVSSILPVVSW